MNEGDRTPSEQRVIEKVAERKGREWAEGHAALILAQARRVGEI